jgi:hypothetical protein
MLFRETVAVYCENHTEHTKAAMCGQSAELSNAEVQDSKGKTGHVAVVPCA